MFDLCHTKSTIKKTVDKTLFNLRQKIELFGNRKRMLSSKDPHETQLYI
jgi:hypothetical protein